MPQTPGRLPASRRASFLEAASFLAASFLGAAPSFLGTALSFLGAAPATIPCSLATLGFGFGVMRFLSGTSALDMSLTSVGCDGRPVSYAGSTGLSLTCVRRRCQPAHGQHWAC